MSFLSACQDVADVIGLTRPTAIVSSTDQIARQMLGIAKEVLEELGLMDWPALEVPYSFPTVVGQGQYALPTDFGREIGDTMYLATQYYQMRGSLSPGDWTRQRQSLPTNLGRYKFRIFGLPQMINITPTPQTVETVTFEYQTTYRVKGSDNSYKTTFFADDDLPLVDENLLKKGLKWRMKRAKGLDYTEEFNEYEVARWAKLAQTLALGSQAVAYRSIYNDTPELAQGYVPEFGYGH